MTENNTDQAGGPQARKPHEFTSCFFFMADVEPAANKVISSGHAVGLETEKSCAIAGQL
jgi:hypothetical protein